MANVTKRINVLKPKLLDIRIGRGAHILPPPPAPQLTEIHLEYPKGGRIKPGLFGLGANDFRKQILPRLKYYNPSLKVSLTNKANSRCRIRLHFEGPDPEALRAIAQSSETAKRLKREAKDPSRVHAADDDEVVLKQQPAADPKAPQTVVPPEALYMRTVSLSVCNKRHWEIWSWVRLRTGGTPVVPTEEDSQMQKEQQKEKRAAGQARRRERDAKAAENASGETKGETLDGAKKPARRKEGTAIVRAPQPAVATPAAAADATAPPTQPETTVAPRVNLSATT